MARADAFAGSKGELSGVDDTEGESLSSMNAYEMNERKCDALICYSPVGKLNYYCC